jgi:adenylyltransferase/sulfurtransferase
MSVRVQIPAPLRECAGGEAEVELVVAVATVARVLVRLSDRYPRLRRHLFDERGRVRGYVNIYLNDEAVIGLQHTEGPVVSPGDTLTIVPSIAGGEAAVEPFTRDELARYSRHLALPDVGLDGQQRLRAGRVAIVGAGGLGSPLGLYLAAAGVGTLGLIDFDAVDVTNLQRQVLYGTSDVGRPKTAAAVERLRDVNPHVRLVEHEVRLTSDNALDVLAPYDVVVDGTDNFPTRYLVNDACVLLRKPYVYGSIYRFDGQVSVFDATRGPCYRCLFREPPPPGLVPSCAEGGVLGVLPGVIGSLQALETLKLLLDRGSSLVGRLALFDALAFHWRELKLKKNPDCPVCGENPTVTGLIDYDEFCGVKPPMHQQAPQGNELPELTPEQLKQRIETGEPLTIIDVREPYEWDISNLAPHGAKLIPLGELADRLDELDPEDEIVIYCRSGSRSGGATRHLKARGFSSVWNLKGGINAWSRVVDPSLPEY